MVAYLPMYLGCVFEYVGKYIVCSMYARAHFCCHSAMPCMLCCSHSFKNLGSSRANMRTKWVSERVGLQQCSNNLSI